MIAPPVIVAIVQQVADEHGFTLAQLVGPSPRHDLARARFCAWYRIRNEVRFRNLPPSLPQIGKWFGGRDHTSILHGLRRYEQIDCLPPARVIVEEAA
jgi:chromosomal replication initiator protein